MAFIHTTDDANLPFFYDVNMAVGARHAVKKVSGGTELTSKFLPNRRDDVFLVQYLLKNIYDNTSAFQPPLVRPEAKEMVVDGLIGPQTNKWIAHFQLEGRNRGNKIATDGAVDPGVHGTSETDITHTFYTIIWMNDAFRTARPDIFPDITQDPDCPPELKGALALNSSAVAV